MHKRYIHLVTVSTILIGLGLPCVAHAQRWNDLEDALEGRELIMRPTIEGRRKVYIEAGDREVFALHRGNRLFPLRASEPVRIIDIDPENDHVEMELSSTRLGRGRVDFYGPAPTASDFELWLDEVFEVITPASDFNLYIGNRKSQTLHLRGANHLPQETEREPFLSTENALNAGYHRCGVCFVVSPDVSDYRTERDLAMFSLQQVRSRWYPAVDTEQQERVRLIGRHVLDNWPVPLKGYRYRFHVIDEEMVNAFAVPTGYIFFTRGMLDSLETDEELEAIMAHEIAHVESRHTYRQWRNSQNVSRWVGIASALAGVSDTVIDDLATAMLSLTTNIFMAGHGRDREREADMFASFYLTHRDIGDQPLENVFKKLKFSTDAVNPFGGGGGLFGTHPDIEERLLRAGSTVTGTFAEEVVFNGLTRGGALVATLRFDVQRFFGRELRVIATLSTTAELGEADNINTLDIRVGGQRLELKERTAEKIFPSDEVSAVFGNDNARGLIQTPVESVNLKLRNVDRWEREKPKNVFVVEETGDRRIENPSSFEGRGVPVNDAEAVRLSRLAASQGEANGQTVLAGMYAEGRGVPQNKERAYMWFTVAAAASRSGEDRDNVVASRDRASAELTFEQLSRAQALATTCFNSNFTDCGEPD